MTATFHHGDWVWCKDRRQVGQVVEVQAIWGTTLYRLWYPASREVAVVPALLVVPLANMGASPYLLFLLTTPHQGKTDAFRRLMALLDPDAFRTEDAIVQHRVANSTPRRTGPSSMTSTLRPWSTPTRAWRGSTASPKKSGSSLEKSEKGSKCSERAARSTPTLAKQPVAEQLPF